MRRIATAGLGFRFEHLDEALEAEADGLWFEVHTENYMVDGGPRLAMLLSLAERFPISLHGVGLSLASPEGVDPIHVRRLRDLADLIDPIAVSDHLAWQRWFGGHHADFLPFPRTEEALAIAAENVCRVQDGLGRRLLVENPSSYVDLPGHEREEADFLSELARRTGCGLLVDVNNIFVSASNLGFAPEPRVDAIPGDLVGEIHLAGHSRDPDPSTELLIDSHDDAVCEPVWSLYDRLVERIGPKPTLIERDDNIPAFAELMRERSRACEVLERCDRAHA